MPRFAANLSMLYPEHDFLDRHAAAAADGFAAVEFLFPYAYPAAELAARLHAHGLQQVLFNAPPGDWDRGERGMACLPGREEEVGVLFAQFHHHPLDDLEPVADAQAVLALMEAVRAVRVEQRLAGYLVDLAAATRRHPELRMGCSPRGTLALMRMTQARAFLAGRDFAQPEDVKAVAVTTLAHRLMLDTKARYSGRSKEDLVRELLEQVPVGV